MLTKRVLPWALALSLSIVAGGGSARADRNTAEAHYKKGMAAYALEDWDGAIAEFQAGFRDEPTPAFLYNIAQSHRMAKRPEDAVRFYQKYLELAPEAPDRGEVEKLITQLKRAIAEQQSAQTVPPTGLGKPEGGAAAAKPAAATPATEAEGAPPSGDTTRPGKSDAPRRSRLGLGLLIGGAIGAVIGGGLVVFGVLSDKQAHDHSTPPLDLSSRQNAEARANVSDGVGYALIAVGAAVAVAGIIRLAIRPREKAVSVGAGFTPGGLAISLGGKF